MLVDLIRFVGANWSKLLEQLAEHVGLTLLSLLIATALAVPAGILATRRQRLASPLLGFAGIMQTVPSIALLGFLLPVLGIGFKPAVAALFLYALLPILRNTYTGIREVDPAIREAAVGMGMTDRQVLRKVELPLALPVIFAGIRTATVINVGVATLAAYIGAGGLGEFIFGGIALNNNAMILAGALPAALLAIGLDQLLARLQHLRWTRRSLAATTLGLATLGLVVLLPGLFNPRLPAAFNPEFKGRPDGYEHFTDVYDMRFNTLLLNEALMYQAVAQEEVDVIFGYSTDGRIKANGLTALADDRQAFPPYFCAPLIRTQLARRAPELVDALERLAGQIPDATMTELNYRVNFENRSPAEVAREFLQSKGLYRPDRKQGGERITIGSKIFTEQYILAELFALLINGYTDYDTDLRLGLGGTKLCFEALRQGDIDIYPEYTGTGYLVILEPPADTVQAVGSAPDAVYKYVNRNFQAAYQLSWLQPLGFNNTYAVIVRESMAQQYGLKKTSDLHGLN